MGYILSYHSSDGSYHEIELTGSSEKHQRQEDMVIKNLEGYCRCSSEFFRKLESMVYSLSVEEELAKANFSLSSINEDISDKTTMGKGNNL